MVAQTIFSSGSVIIRYILSWEGCVGTVVIMHLLARAAADWLVINGMHAERGVSSVYIGAPGYLRLLYEGNNRPCIPPFCTILVAGQGSTKWPAPREPTRWNGKTR